MTHRNDASKVGSLERLVLLRNVLLRTRTMVEKSVGIAVNQRNNTEVERIKRLPTFGFIICQDDLLGMRNNTVEMCFTALPHGCRGLCNPTASPVTTTAL